MQLNFFPFSERTLYESKCVILAINFLPLSSPIWKSLKIFQRSLLDTKCKQTIFYCLLVWYSFIFDPFGASQAVHRCLWYIKSPSWMEIWSFFSCFVISAQVSKKSTWLLPAITEYQTSREYINFAPLQFFFLLSKLVIKNRSCLFAKKVRFLSLFLSYWIIFSTMHSKHVTKLYIIRYIEPWKFKSKFKLYLKKIKLLN